MNTPKLQQLALASLAIVGAYVGTAWYLGAGIVDDTYIFLRYARNIVEGFGPVFNVGERVEGFTSPAWLAALTAMSWTSFDPPSSSVICSAALGLVTVLVVGWPAGHEPRGAHLLAAAFLATSPPFVFWCWSGMDTALFTLLMVATFVSFERGRTDTLGRLRTGLLMAAAAFTRLEAIWMLPLLGYHLLRRSDGRPRTFEILALVGPTLILLGTYELWRLSYYGAWLPNTFYAKADVPRLTVLRQGLVYAGKALLSFAPLVVLAAPELRRPLSTRFERARLPLLAIAWWTCYVVLVGGDHFALFRFFVPAIGLFALAAGRIVAALQAELDSRRVVAVAGGVLLATNLFLFISPQAEIARSEVQQAEAWADTGRWCDAHLPAGSVASLVVGAIPYYCNRETFDLLGLVDSYVARNGKVFLDAAVGHQKYATDYILSREPRYIFFTSSGQAVTPLFAEPESRRLLPERTNRALIDLTTHPRVLRDYDYRAERLANGRFVEFLELRR